MTTTHTSNHIRAQSVSSRTRTRSMLDGRRDDSMRRRQRVLAALDQAAAAGDRLSTSAIARAAGVDRTFLYRHPRPAGENPCAASRSSPRRPHRPRGHPSVAAGRPARRPRTSRPAQRPHPPTGEAALRSARRTHLARVRARCPRRHRRTPPAHHPARTAQPRPSTTTRRTRRRPRRRPRRQPRTHGPTQHANPAAMTPRVGVLPLWHIHVSMRGTLAGLGMIAATCLVFLVCVHFTRPPAARSLAALLSGVPVVGVNIAADVLAYQWGWWRYPGVGDHGVGPVFWYIGAAIGVSGLTLIGWRVHRRWGFGGTIVFLLAFALYGSRARLGRIPSGARRHRLRRRRFAMDCRLCGLVGRCRHRRRRPGALTRATQPRRSPTTSGP